MSGRERKSPVEMSTEMLVVASLSRGIALADWHILTFGMILDIIIEHDNLNIDTDDDSIARYATQEDFNAF